MINRINELREMLNKYAQAYYKDDNPQVSDFDYDVLYNELLDLEKRYPEYYDPNSITQRVGGEVLDAFVKVKHPNAMYSLGNAYNLEDLKAFQQRVENEVGKCFYCAELKIDGLAISLHYKDGVLIQALTRGDGEVGENVTNNVKTIRSLPLIIDEKRNIEIRGEVFLSKSQLLKINKKRLLEGLEKFANCRNAAAGSIRQLDSKVAASRSLDGYWYQVVNPLDLSLKLHSESLEYLNELGFKTNKLRLVSKDMDEIFKFIMDVESKRSELDYDIDGVVVKVDSLIAQEQLGHTIKVPKWAIAYKFKAEEVESELLEIFLTVGRTGKVTPNARLKNVFVGGTNVGFAQLHNEDYINDKDIRVGDTVIVRKAGDIIPEVYAIVKDKRKADSIKWKFPKRCPNCDSELHRLMGESDTYCFNPDCSARVVESIVHFASRDCLNIDGFGEQTVKNFYEIGWIKKIEDIFHLENFKEEIINTKGYGKKSYQRMIDGVEEAKKQPFEKLLCGLGIRHIGEKASRLLANTFIDIDNLMKASVEDIANIYEMGEAKALSVNYFFKDSKNQELIEELRLVGCNLKSEVKEIKKSYFTGKKIVLTGTLTTMSRKNAEKLIIEFGGKCTSSVSRETDLVIYGESAGSKLAKAEALGVKCINEIEFNGILDGGK